MRAPYSDMDTFCTVVAGACLVPGCERRNILSQGGERMTIPNFDEKRHFLYFAQ